MINGQKMWTSLIGYADYVWLACRTDQDAPRHKGLSIIIVPTSAAGFSWTPVPTVAGVSTSATYYSDVRVPAANLVGEEHRGWSLITNQLNHERVALTSAAPTQNALREVRDWAARTPAAGGGLVIDAEWVQTHLARVHARTEVLKLLNWQIAARLDAGQALGPAAASATKIYGTELTIEACRLLMEVLGSAAAGQGRLAWRAARGPDRADAQVRADPDLRRRHERNPAGHDRDARARPALPALTSGEALWTFRSRRRRRNCRPWPGASSQTSKARHG